MLELMDKGGDMVSREQLQPLLDWLDSRNAAQ